MVGQVVQNTAGAWEVHAEVTQVNGKVSHHVYAVLAWDTPPKAGDVLYERNGEWRAPRMKLRTAVRPSRVH